MDIIYILLHPIYILYYPYYIRVLNTPLAPGPVSAPSSLACLFIIIHLATRARCAWPIEVIRGITSIASITSITYVAWPNIIIEFC